MKEEGVGRKGRVCGNGRERKKGRRMPLFSAFFGRLSSAYEVLKSTQNNSPLAHSPSSIVLSLPEGQEQSLFGLLSLAEKGKKPLPSVAFTGRLI